jgi:hypothetical protein
MAGMPTLDERELRQRSAIELADLATAACRRSFPVLVSVSLAFALPASAVFWAALAVGSTGLIVAGSVVLAAGLLLAHAGCVDAVGDDWFGGVPSAAGSIRRTLRRAPAVLLLWLAGLVPAVLGAFLLVLPGVMVVLLLVPAVPVMVLERVRPLAAVRRAWKLSSRRTASHFGALASALALVFALLLILVQPVLAAAVVGSGRDAPWLVAAAVGQVALCVLVVPLFAGVSMAAYVDARIRKEGLDLLYLLSRVDAAGAAA